MSEPSIETYPFGDLLALARQSWILSMTRELEDRGYRGYRRSDPAAVRLLWRRGPLPIGQLGNALGVTRQAARKLVSGLDQRGLARLVRDRGDRRQVNVELTPAGIAYAEELVAVIAALNRSVAEQVTPEQLAAADTVLRASLGDEHTKTLAAHLRLPASS